MREREKGGVAPGERLLWLGCCCCCCNSRQREMRGGLGWRKDGSPGAATCLLSGGTSGSLLAPLLLPSSPTKEAALAVSGSGRRLRRAARCSLLPAAGPLLQKQAQVEESRQARPAPNQAPLLISGHLGPRNSEREKRLPVWLLALLYCASHPPRPVSLPIPIDCKYVYLYRQNRHLFLHFCLKRSRCHAAAEESRVSARAECKSHSNKSKPSPWNGT